MTEKVQLMHKSKRIFGLTFLATLLFAPLCAGVEARGETPSSEPKSNAATAALGVIRGSVRDDKGSPIGGAVIAIWREGVATVRQITSNADGSFVTRVLPGRYSLTAMADGYSVVSLSNVEVERSDEVAFRFKLIRTGSGNKLSEKRSDRNNSKYVIRSNASRRSIYQNNEVDGEIIADLETDLAEETTDAEENNSGRASQSTVETYFAAGAGNQHYYGMNFATVQPINEKLNLVFAGQTGIGSDAPQRFETAARFKLNEKHQINISVGAASLGKVQLDNDSEENDLGQLSFQAYDEWRVRDGIVLVLGVDYSRFVGASNADSLAPRIGLQFETDSKTRLNFAYTTQTEQRTWQEAADLEDSRVLFRQPVFDSYAIADRQVLMPKLRRLEFGIERVLDNSSNLEATAFFDTTTNRGVSFVQMPLSGFATDENPLTAAQNGSSQGIRVVYSRRLNEIFSTALGYSAGRGQSLSEAGLTNPSELFNDELFQTFAAQVSANFDTGTEVRAVYRVSPRGAVFAIDPFAGRMAFYDPSLSVLVTQNLPTLGLPVRAKAMFDARNLFDLQTMAANGDAALRLNSSRRFLRGGIAVRF